MARDGLFPAGVAAVHPRFGTPARAIALQAALASLLALTGTFRGIVAYFIFVTVAFIALTVGAVYVLRRRGGRRPAYSAFGYPITPAIFIVQAAVLMALLAAGQPLQALAGTAVVLLGIPVYSLVRR
jgi:APA family basic amino acid/polyamine antiporter